MKTEVPVPYYIELLLSLHNPSAIISALHSELTH